MTPEQEEQVRRALRALADAQPSQPMPEDVAHRLDDVLADLAAARSTGSGSSAAARDELAARRRRRWPKIVLAAAAVSATALAGAAVATRQFGGADGKGSSSRAASPARSSSANGTAGTAGTAGAGTATASPGARSFGTRERPGARSVSGAAGATTGPLGTAAPSASAGPVPSAVPGGRPLPRLSSTALRHGVQSLVDRGLVDDLAVGRAGTSAARSALAPCRVPVAGNGADLLGVRLDGHRATLVVLRPAHGVRVARVYGCTDTGTPVATTTVAGP